MEDFSKQQELGSQENQKLFFKKKEVKAKTFHVEARLLLRKTLANDDDIKKEVCRN